jgi:hypothetical protein
MIESAAPHIWKLTLAVAVATWIRTPVSSFDATPLIIVEQQLDCLLNTPWYEFSTAAK